MPDPFLDEEEEAEEPDPKRFSISVSPDAKADLKSIGEYWTAHRKVTGKGRRRKWKLSSVCERFIRNQLEAYWKQIGAQHLKTPEERRDFMDRLLAEAKKSAKKK